ncbi:MAG: type 1 glutamine amidotransferase, partial [Actinomycetota bacterium]|nr:type 1 glutamine amidotransferase [Actinomycetota bacterium]
MFRARLLVVQHEDACPPALFGTWLAAVGVVLDVRRPYAGEPLPSDLQEHHGLLVLGGEMGAYDDAERGWLGDTKKLLRSAAETSTPALGICLGHQLAAVALGGEVRHNPAGQATGLTAIGWVTQAGGDPLLAGVADGGHELRAVQWNNDVVTVPPTGAHVLARAADGTPQIVRFTESLWGVQFHPEVDDDVFGLWVARGRDRAAARGI